MLPNWADSVEDVVDQVIISHGETVNIPREGAAGDSIHIGIIDSAWALPPELSGGFDVRDDPGNAFIDPDEEVTAPHCESVFDLASTFCPRATFSLYQAVDDEKSLPIAAFADAVSKAIDDGVDILNISAGDPWPGPVDANPAVQQVKRAIDENITVVAAAGNFQPGSQDRRPPIHCPAAYEPVIAVGGLEVRCPVEPGDESAGQDGRPYYCIPRQERVSAVRPVEHAFCGQRGCVDGQSCITNQKEVEWEFNPSPTDQKPDILAPMHRPVGSTEGPHMLKVGTSFAAPIVTASLGCIYSEVLEMGEELPRPREARNAVIEGGFPIDEGAHNKYDAMATRDALGVF